MASSLVVRVFAIAELLEYILADFDFKQLSRCQRVAKSWDALIKTSKVFRQTRFSDAAPASEVIKYERPPGSRVDCAYIADARLVEGYPIARLHPAVAHASYRHRSFTESKAPFTRQPLVSSDPAMRHCFILIFRASKFQAWARQSIFKDALLTQPPCTSIELFGLRNCTSIDLFGLRNFKYTTPRLARFKQDGVTIGYLNEIIEQALLPLGDIGDVGVAVGNMVLDCNDCVKEARLREAAEIASVN